MGRESLIHDGCEGSKVAACDTPRHGPAGPAERHGDEWVRSCLCGREFVSRQNWQHVPALYDHLAIAAYEDRQLAAAHRKIDEVLAKREVTS